MRTLAVLLASISVSILFGSAQTGPKDITCDGGSGEYRTEFSTGITVEVGPMRKGAFAERACSARLVGKGQDVSVVDDAGQVGIDVLGADLGLGKPVVAFQIDQTGRGNNVEYLIYSLSKPIRLLYSLKGGRAYSAADTDLDGRIEIWSDDAAAVDGFEGIPAGDFDFVPTVILRFDKGRLMDVGSEFAAYYDSVVAKIRSQMSSRDLSQFKRSDGKLFLKSVASAGELHQLIRAKIDVLELVWAYLYSGREKDAWAALDEMWPPEDVGRIRNAISEAHARGMLHNVERPRRASYRRSRAKVYDAVAIAPVVSTINPYGGAPDTSQTEPPIVQPKSILLRRPPSSADGGVPSENETVELVVDAAGKVRSAQVIKAVDAPLVQATSGWHFIPAFRDGVPVACRFRLSVWTLK